jgi:hypothetical protein
MEYQHLVFGEFSRKVQPLIKPFAAYDPTIRPDITGEFAHAVYRYGHSQLNETVDRKSASGADLSVPLLYGFLNPTEFNQPHNYSDPRAPLAIGSELNALDGTLQAMEVIRERAMEGLEKIDYATEIEKINSVSPFQIQEMANKYFSQDNFTEVRVTP